MRRMLPDWLKERVPWRVRVLAERVEWAARGRLLSLVTPTLPLPGSVRERRVMFIGASVGRAWRLELVFPNIRAVAAYQYDKSELVQQAAAERPEGVILKECAAYFPSEREPLHMVPRWVDQLRTAGIAVALATVAPVTREHAAQVPGRAEGLWRFNDALRDYCSGHEVPLLDLEAALRVSPTDRHLDGALHSGDGLHLSRRTYRRRLDPLIPPLLLRMFTRG